MPVSELSPGVYGWQGGEGLSLPRAAGAAGGGTSAIAELLTQIGDQKVFVGLHQAAEDAKLLEAEGICAILAVGSAPKPCAADVMMKLSLKLGDMEKDPLLGHLPKAFAFINDALAEGGVLLQCEDGEDEAGAAAVAVGWLMAHCDVPWADAPRTVSAARPSAVLNANYEKQLRVWRSWKTFPAMPEWM